VGAYAIQPGFQYAVYAQGAKNKLLPSQSKIAP